MRYLTKRVILYSVGISFYAFLGVFIGESTSTFTGTLAFLTGFIALVYVIVSIKTLIKEDNKFFESEPEDKIRVYTFFRKPIYVISFVDVILILFLISGQLDHFPPIKTTLEVVVLALFFIIVIGLGWTIDDTISRNFNYNIYRASIELAVKNKSDKQSLYFLFALRHYDKYLRRRFGLAIKNLESIFSHFAQMEAEEKQSFLNSLPTSYEDSLAPLRVITSKFEDINGDFLVSVSYHQKLKDTVSFIIPIIAIGTTIIQLVLRL